jgi:cytochrome c556
MLPLTRILSLLGCLAFMIPSGIQAQDAERTPIQDYRQSIMEALDRHNRAIRSIVDGDVDRPNHVVDHAIAVEGLARMLADVFPAGSGEGTRARDEIWETPGLFSEKVSGLMSTSAALVEAARSGDAEAIVGAAQQVNRSCGGCHQGFRARPR